MNCLIITDTDNINYMEVLNSKYNVKVLLCDNIAKKVINGLYTLRLPMKDISYIKRLINELKIEHIDFIGQDNVDTLIEYLKNEGIKYRCLS